VTTEYDPAMVGDKWQGAVTLEVIYDDGGTPEKNTLDFYAEQEQKNKPACCIRIVHDHAIYTVLGLRPKQLERLAEFLNDAADMIRHCSE
jgi:hypothetical protein